MSLAPGVRLGPYEVIAQIGVGGMGEVWRATDTNLKRAVALKVLPEAVAADRDRLARFQREAEVLAALNHPNIAHIHGLEKSGGTTALVMELVEGPTLADRIARGPLPVDEALAIAKQMAEALEAAHEQGIVHRDLKPANVKVRDDGSVKVLDFGLAKALEPAGAMSSEVSRSPTITTPAMTQAGMILGTAAYMSPEQARGKPVDKRTDIWAFGAVLYEMLTGKRAFEDEDVSLTLSKVLRLDPDFDNVPADVPARVQRVLLVCLRKDPKQRVGDIRDVRLALDGAFETAAPPAAPPRPLWRRAIPVAVAAIVAGALTLAAAWSLRPSPPALAVTRFVFPLPDGQGFTNPGRNTVAISPDGSRMVYVANSRLYLRSLSEVDARPIAGTENLQSVLNPVFSPDGQSVAFFTLGDNTIKRIAVTGGAAVTIAPATFPFGMSWGPDGIVFGQLGAGILRVSAAGGTPQVLVKVNETETAGSPQVLPDGAHVLFTLATGTAPDRWEQAQVVVQSLASGERRVIVEGGSSGRYLPTGHVVYARGGSLFAVGFDARRLEVTGAGAVSIVEGVRRAPLMGAAATGVAHFSVSDSGSLIFVPGPATFVATAPLSLALIDRKGVVESLNLPAGPYEHPRVSPDGRRIAVGVNDPKEAYISIYDLAGGTTIRRLTFGANNRFPIWSRDSQRVTFQSDRDGDQAIFWQLADGTGAAERLTKPDKGTAHAPQSWSPKDETLLFVAVKPGPAYSLWTFSRASRKEEPFGGVQTSTVIGGTVIGAVFSPDGRWVAYSSGEAGRITVYVQPFPATGAKYQLAAKSGDLPHHQVWSPDGRELFYNPRPNGFEVVPVMTLAAFAFGNPTAVPAPFVTGPPSFPRHFDITPDGKFLGLVAPGVGASGTTARQEIQVVLNWFEELKRLVPIN